MWSPKDAMYNRVQGKFILQDHKLNIAENISRESYASTTLFLELYLIISSLMYLAN